MDQEPPSTNAIIGMSEAPTEEQPELALGNNVSETEANKDENPLEDANVEPTLTVSNEENDGIPAVEAETNEETIKESTSKANETVKPLSEQPKEAEKSGDETTEDPPESEKSGDEITKDPPESEKSGDEITKDPPESEKSGDEITKEPPESEKTIPTVTNKETGESGGALVTSETSESGEDLVVSEASQSVATSNEPSQSKALADDLEDEDDLEDDADFEVVNQADVPKMEELSAYDLEMKKVGAEVIFPPSVSSSWTNLKWLSYTRSVRFCGLCTRMVITKKKWFGGTDTETYHTRKLAIYQEPNLILILRPAANAQEVQTMLDIGDEPVNPRSYLVAETVIDPMTCKLRLSPLTTPTSIESSATGDVVSPHRQTCFQLVAPTETVFLSALRPKEDKAIVNNSVGFLETTSMEAAVGIALFAAHCPAEHLSSSDIAWKHQLVLGTLTSTIISGSQTQLEQALAAAIARNRDGAKVVPTRVIDELDDSGRTALHYACARRNSAAVTALIGAGANPSIPIPSEGGEILPIHLAAKTLDDMSLSTILSAPRRPNPNALDSQGRTAMYLAVTDGASSDPMALSKCLSALKAWGGEMGTDVNPITISTTKWRYAALGPLLANEGFRYPLKLDGTSVGAIYSYPLHTALVELRKKINAIGEENSSHGFGGGDTLKSQLRGTLQVLLEHGFEPNERIEKAVGDLSELVGFTPLQVLAAAALDAERLSSKSNVKLSTSILSSVASTLAGAADVLVQCGARLNMDPPPTDRFNAKSTSSEDQKDETAGLPAIDRSNLKIEGNKDMMDLLGGKGRLEACRKLWLDEKAIEGTTRTMICQDKACIESGKPGGNSEKSCAICWRAFGTIMNRKHKCRVSVKYVCDECSGKRVVEGGQEHRLSDGQFLLAKTDAKREKSDRIVAQQEDVQRRKNQMEQVRQKRLEEEKAEEDQRGSLFGNIVDKATTLLAGDDEELDEVGSLQNKLGQTRDALNERGQRLGDLSEKTEKLMNASEDFAKMAKELEQSQKGLFW